MITFIVSTRKTKAVHIVMHYTIFLNLSIPLTIHFNQIREIPPQPPLEVRRAVQSFFEDRG